MADENKDEKAEEAAGEKQAAEDGGKTENAGSAGEGQGGVTDSHGQPGINKERHDREMAEKDKEIADLKAKLDEAVKTSEGRDSLKAEIAALEARLSDQDVSYRLELAGCLNAKAAKALLEDYGNDVEKLKATCPYLFAEKKQTGTTGAKPEGSGRDEGEFIDKVLAKFK